MLFKISWQTLFIFFTSILLFINLALAFNVQFLSPVFSRDDTYFGISSLIEYFDNIGGQDNLVGNFHTFVVGMNRWLTDLVTGQVWTSLDLSTFLGTLSAIGNALAYCIYPILYIVNGVMYTAYVMSLALSLVIYTFDLLMSYNAHQLPTYTYEVIHMCLLCV